MLNESAACAASDRDDLSRYMVHLTRDDRNTYPGGQSAEKNFAAILDDLEIQACGAHCLHSRQVKALGDEVEDLFNVACFTETPLRELKKLLNVGWRKIYLEPYGFVFDRDFLLRNGAQHVTYINNYAGNDERRYAYDQIFKIAAKGPHRPRPLCLKSRYALADVVVAQLPAPAPQAPTMWPWPRTAKQLLASVTSTERSEPVS